MTTFDHIPETPVGELKPYDRIPLFNQRIGATEVNDLVTVVDVQPIPYEDWDHAERTWGLLPHALHVVDTNGEHFRWRVPGGCVGFTVIPDHHPVCAADGNLWPCREHAIDRTVAHEAQRAEDEVEQLLEGGGQ